MFNSGQSCCGIERIYVHASIYDAFVEEFVSVVKSYKLGDPMDKTTSLGPVVSLASAERIRKQVADAGESTTMSGWRSRCLYWNPGHLVAQGAKSLVEESHFQTAKVGTAFVGPQVLVDVNHTMEVMMEEVG
jgi:acyl-CoA reductase-like NAD-dependent aldehyde dehydrogenase